MAADVAPPTGSRYYFDISFATPFTAPFATFFAAAPIGPQPSSSFSLFVVASFLAAGGCCATLCFLVVVIFLLFLAIDLSLLLSGRGRFLAHVTSVTPPTGSKTYEIVKPQPGLEFQLMVPLGNSALLAREPLRCSSPEQGTHLLFPYLGCPLDARKALSRYASAFLVGKGVT
jgi:hypothetical protein